MLLQVCLLRYYSKSFKKDLPQCLDILSDILLNSVIDADALEVEKRVILREMEEVEKQTEEVIFDRLHMAVRRRCASDDAGRGLWGFKNQRLLLSSRSLRWAVELRASLRLSGTAP